jgi:hypothetical protein
MQFGLVQDSRSLTSKADDVAADTDASAKLLGIRSTEAPIETNGGS